MPRRFRAAVVFTPAEDSRTWLPEGEPDQGDTLLLKQNNDGWRNILAWLDWKRWHGWTASAATTAGAHNSPAYNCNIGETAQVPSEVFSYPTSNASSSAQNRELALRTSPM